MNITELYNNPSLKGECLISPFKHCVSTFGHAFQDWTDQECTAGQRIWGLIKRIAAFVIGLFGAIATSLAVPVGLMVKFFAKTEPETPRVPSVPDGSASDAQDKGKESPMALKTENAALPVLTDTKVEKTKVEQSPVTMTSPAPQDIEEESPIGLATENAPLPVLTETKEKETKVEHLPVMMTSNVVSTDVDEAAFQEYLFSDPQIIPQIRALLENTVCKAPSLTPEITWSQVVPKEDEWEAMMAAPIASNAGKLELRPDWFDYTEANHFFIDFCHATSFGGAYRSYGCVQEERMFAEFRALPILDFITKNGIHPCLKSDKGGVHDYPPSAKAAPFIIESIHRQNDISKTPYGGAFQKASKETILKGIIPVESPVPVNIIGLAAVDFRGKKGVKYTLKDLTYHFQAATLGNLGAKEVSMKRGFGKTVVHTAPWGCGAFLNSEKMMTAIQYLAARAVGVDLVFHGVGNPLNTHYTEKNVNEINAWISSLIDSGHTPEEILNVLLKKSQTDATWGPRC